MLIYTKKHSWAYPFNLRFVLIVIQKLDFTQVTQLAAQY